MRISGRTSHEFISVGGDGGGDESGGEHVSARISQKQARFRRGRNQKGLIRPSLPSVAVVCILLGLAATVFAFRFLSPDREIQGRFDGQDNDDDEMKHELRIDLQTLFNKTIPSKELRFGRGSIAGGRDSRYWDRDDRRRDDEYDEDVVDDSVSTSDDAGNERGLDNKSKEGRIAKEKVQDNQNVKGLYNEADRQELKKFEKKYEESLYSKPEQQGNGDEVKSTDEYDDGLDMDDDIFGKNDNHEELALDGRIKKSRVQREMVINGSSVATLKSSLHKKMDSGHGGDGTNLLTKTFGTKNKPSSKGRKRRSSCEMKLLDTSQLIEPLVNKKFSRFSLQYKKSEDRPDGIDNWVPLFAGHQSLREREESFYARDQLINCGFVKGPEGSPSTGFDMAEDDMNFMSSCHIAVSSCIFGNSDHLRTPYIKTITRSSRKNVCFVMFMDENTLQTLSAEGQQPDSMGFIGLWKIVVVKNLPYDDMRRVGKIPKFLTHRLFPSARYSIWLDSKLRLQSDPLLILEYFLWRKGYEYAISNHYDRHCVWEEVMQNKKLNKFNHTIIDQQFEFYQADGLKKFDPSDPNRLLPSYVPEGSFIMRAHTPMSNLFSCLWFNEVDRFTPRDQLSFAYTFMKLRRMNPQKLFHLHMFKDCERRSIAKLFRHRGEVKRHSLTQEVV